MSTKVVINEVPKYKLSIANGADQNLSVTNGIELQVTANVGEQGPAGPQGETGPAGPNEITTSTSTNLTGFIYGNGTNVGGATEGSTFATESTLAVRDESGNLTANAFILPDGQNTATIENAALTASQTYTLPDSTGYISLTKNANGSNDDTEIYVKAAEPIAAGQAVYISSASGKNKIISLAQANTDALSSKTIGISAQSLAHNDFGYVVTEGDLSGLSINLGSGHGIEEGDPIWLSPTTAGGLLFGLANKPSAPDHLVFLGIVTNINGNTLTDIYVKVQNGFELEELHNVQISFKTQGSVLSYSQANETWTAETTQVLPVPNSIPRRNSNSGMSHAYLRLHYTGNNPFYAQINPPDPSPQFVSYSYTLPKSSGTLLTNNTGVTLTGAQTIGGDKTFTGQLKATLQIALENDDLMTLKGCDQRYARNEHVVQTDVISAPDTTPVEICGRTYGIGTYRIEAFVASVHSQTGGTIIALNADKAIRIQAFENYGRPTAGMFGNALADEDMTSSVRSDIGGTEFLRMITGIVFVREQNTRISMTIAQQVANATPTTTRKRSYIILTRLF